MMHIKRHTLKMRTSRTCFNSYRAKFIYKKVMSMLTIISRMVYSIRFLAGKSPYNYTRVLSTDKEMNSLKKSI
jgi:hypothetical protein